MAETSKSGVEEEARTHLLDVLHSDVVIPLVLFLYPRDFENLQATCSGWNLPESTVDCFYASIICKEFGLHPGFSGSHAPLSCPERARGEKGGYGKGKEGEKTAGENGDGNLKEGLGTLPTGMRARPACFSFEKAAEVDTRGGNMYILSTDRSLRQLYFDLDPPPTGFSSLLKPWDVVVGRSLSAVDCLRDREERMKGDVQTEIPELYPSELQWLDRRRRDQHKRRHHKRFTAVLEELGGSSDDSESEGKGKGLDEGGEQRFKRQWAALDSRRESYWDFHSRRSRDGAEEVMAMYRGKMSGKEEEKQRKKNMEEEKKKERVERRRGRQRTELMLPGTEEGVGWGPSVNGRPPYPVADSALPPESEILSLCTHPSPYTETEEEAKKDTEEAEEEYKDAVANGTGALRFMRQTDSFIGRDRTVLGDRYLPQGGSVSLVAVTAQQAAALQKVKEGGRAPPWECGGSMEEMGAGKEGKETGAASSTRERQTGANKRCESGFFSSSFREKTGEEKEGQEKKNDDLELRLAYRPASYFEVRILKDTGTTRPPRSTAATASRRNEVRPMATFGSRLESLHEDSDELEEASIFDLPNRGRPMCVSIGVARSCFQFQRKQVGWDSDSWGLHGDDGRLFHGSSHSTLNDEEWMKPFGPGDTIGCGVLCVNEVNDWGKDRGLTQDRLRLHIPRSEGRAHTGVKRRTRGKLTTGVTGRGWRGWERESEREHEAGGGKKKQNQSAEQPQSTLLPSPRGGSESQDDLCVRQTSEGCLRLIEKTKETLRWREANSEMRTDLNILSKLPTESRRWIFYTRNGKFWGFAFCIRGDPFVPLLPAVGIDANYAVEMNFGTSRPFEFNLDLHFPPLRVPSSLEPSHLSAPQFWPPQPSLNEADRLSSSFPSDGPSSSSSSSSAVAQPGSDEPDVRRRKRVKKDNTETEDRQGETEGIEGKETKQKSSTHASPTALTMQLAPHVNHRRFLRRWELMGEDVAAACRMVARGCADRVFRLFGRTSDDLHLLPFASPHALPPACFFEGLRIRPNSKFLAEYEHDEVTSRLLNNVAARRYDYSSALTSVQQKVTAQDSQHPRLTEMHTTEALLRQMGQRAWQDGLSAQRRNFQSAAMHVMPLLTGDADWSPLHWDFEAGESLLSTEIRGRTHAEGNRIKWSQLPCGPDKEEVIRPISGVSTQLPESPSVSADVHRSQSLVSSSSSSLSQRAISSSSSLSRLQTTGEGAAAAAPTPQRPGRTKSVRGNKQQEKGAPQTDRPTVEASQGKCEEGRNTWEGGASAVSGLFVFGSKDNECPGVSGASSSSRGEVPVEREKKKETVEVPNGPTGTCEEGRSERMMRASLHRVLFPFHPQGAGLQTRRGRKGEGGFGGDGREFKGGEGEGLGRVGPEVGDTTEKVGGDMHDILRYCDP
eukprot:Cvel_7422.t1-p1 / transcript=Cvel_7422.t1 / gene=Cvel_7422 / organism=Chromera_velia_CCMP2878 / gene_product=hypothetical protein / transcript_product=hypothetical protein / location=Cvel_scaffold387:81875-92461(+) / protein_length=1406 / sequence_SO=supercontig / SO=protein_coding / is_pseudo=false